MRTVLHIITRRDDALAAEVIAQQKANSELVIKVADLVSPDPDYLRLLEEVFAADSVSVW